MFGLRLGKLFQVKETVFAKVWRQEIVTYSRKVLSNLESG